MALGTISFGWHTDEADSIAIMDRALDVGINVSTIDHVFDGLSQPH